MCVTQSSASHAVHVSNSRRVNVAITVRSYTQTLLLSRRVDVAITVTGHLTQKSRVALV